MEKETYGRVKDAWAEESNSTRQNSRMMKDLREGLQVNVVEQIKKQRLSQMEKGTRFSKYRMTGKEKDKEIYCKLDSNHKTLHYKDVNKGDEVNTEIRSRLVAKEIKRDNREDLFAATPPLLSRQRNSSLVT